MLFGLGMALILLGGIVRFGSNPRREWGDRLFRIGILGGSFLSLIPAVAVLAGFDRSSTFPELLRTGTGGPFAIDLLSAWFLVVVLVAGASAGAFGTAYLRHEPQHRHVGTAHLGFAVLLVGLSGVVTARTVLAFLISWEIMAVAAYFLIIFESDQPGVRRSGLLYLVLTHLGSLALISMFAAWTGGFPGGSFDELAASGSGVPVALVLSLALLGFGIKAGVLPVHFWLPGAHAAAPSHVSAILSGVMLKVGIYGLLRVLLLLGPPPAWWGWTVLLLGTVSAVLGVLWALAQHDVKRLLAYHSVENIGIILMGLGLGALGSTYHEPAVALLGYTGALLHTLNHALFKSLLFLGAGALGHVAGTREIDRLGGLARRAKGTAIAFLVGSIAIVGLPPLNGFVSEWLIFTGLLESGLAGGGVRAASALTVGLALTGALALACFTKLYGTVFLGTPRDQRVASHPGTESGLVFPQIFLAAACVAIGVFPLPFLSAAGRTAGLLVPEAADFDLTGMTRAALPITWIAFGLLGATAVVWILRRMAARRRPARTAATWGCAYGQPTSHMQYSASSYAAPILAAFGPISGSHVHREPGSFETHPTDMVLDAMRIRLWKRIGRAAGHLRGFQSGGIRRYLIYVIVTLLCLLLYLRAGASR
jgi:hydrogenase-4 component B